MRNSLPRRRDESVRVEEEAERRRRSSQVSRLDDPRELVKPLRQVGDPGSGGETAALVATPGRRDGSLREVGEEAAKVVRLLELAFADAHEVGEVAANGGEKFAGDGGLAVEESEEGVLDAVEASSESRYGLEGTSNQHGSAHKSKTTHLGQDLKPLDAGLLESAHPGRLSRSCSLLDVHSDRLVVVAQRPHFEESQQKHRAWLNGQR